RPGIRIRPIEFISGEQETNEVFFDDVRTPVADRVGEIDEGWPAAKALMAIARSNNTTTGLLRRALRAAARGVAGNASSQQLLELAMRVDAFEALEARAADGEIPISAAATSSILKLLATELHQAITKVGLDLSPNSQFAQAKYLSTRAATIYSGTSEVHRNILAHAIGCP
ncbi:MAG TPA: acyl-CoA dehydrogenase, partial [Hyphomonas sp.]|nr:acyl-CoA dehydrogenase [Hyphomonas sp.]